MFSFWVFSLFSVIEFVHVTNFVYHDCFFAAFYQVLRFVLLYRECYGFERAFYYSQAFFTLHSFTTFGTTCFYQDFPGSWQFFIEDCSASHWVSKYRPSPSVCLDQTVFSKKVLVSRFYLCVKVLWNTISNFFRFSTHSLIATYIVKCMSYPLGHRSS